MYKKTTPIYHIPYISEGERVSQRSEALAATIVENALFAGTCGVPDALFEDGQYTLHNMQDGTYTLIVAASGTFSLCGLVNHRLFRTEEPVLFEKLELGKQYLIYVGYQPELDADPTQFVRVATQNRKEGTGYVLLANIDLMGTEPHLDEEPDGKLYSRDVLQHSSDQTNPHGRRLTQDELRVLERLTVAGRPVHGSVYLRSRLNGNGIPTLFTLENQIVHVSVMPMEDGAGSIWCKMEGNVLHIYNTGRGVLFSAEVKVM